VIEVGLVEAVETVVIEVGLVEAVVVVVAREVERAEEGVAVEGRPGEEAVMVGVGEVVVVVVAEGEDEVPSAVVFVRDAGAGEDCGGRKPGISEENMMR
jgi:hypothetical protein